jgi:hypothetical protein
MENIIQPTKQHDNADIQAFFALFVFLICVECAKGPEYQCEKCDKVYKQGGRYYAHIAKCCDKNCGIIVTRPRDELDIIVSSSDISELLRQNREMIMIMQKQQETIQVLVSKLLPVTK